ncbi:MAG: ADP-ribosyltransferase [Dermatophilaceae bacterium]
MALDAFTVKLDSPEAIRVAAAGLVRSFQAVADRAQEVRTTWLALGGFYRAPEQEVLLSAMNTPAERAETLLGQARTVGEALEVYADALADLHAKQAVLATDIAGFYQDRAEIDAENEHNNVLEDIADGLDGEQEKLLHRENQLMDRVCGLQAEKDTAELNCANAIGALWGAEPFELADQTTAWDETTYGMSADGYAELTRAGDAPWGRPDAWDSDNWLVRGNMLFTGAGESITGTIGFFGDLLGQGDDGSADAAWSGLGQLAADSLRFASLPILAMSALSDPDGTQESAERLVAVGKSTIGWDTWDSSGWYTGGSVGLDVGLAAASLGAGGAVKGSVRGAAATRFAKLLDHAGDAGIDIRTAAAAARLRLNSTLTTHLHGLATISDDLSTLLNQLHPATPDGPIPASKPSGPDLPDPTGHGPKTPDHSSPGQPAPGDSSSPDPSHSNGTETAPPLDHEKMNSGHNGSEPGAHTPEPDVSPDNSETASTTPVDDHSSPVGEHDGPADGTRGLGEGSGTTDDPKNFPHDPDAIKYGSAEWDEYVERLPEDQKRAVHDYTKELGPGIEGLTYKEINEALRGQRDKTPELQQRIDLIDKSLAGHPVPEDVMITRGTGIGHYDEVDPRKMVGKLIDEEAYMSTSLGGPAESFKYREAILHLQVPKGTPAMWVDKVSAFTGANTERELLLGRGLSYRIDRVELVNGQWQIHGKIVDNGRTT